MSVRNTLTDAEKMAVARQIRKELPQLEHGPGHTVVRIYQVDELIEFVYNIYSRGVEIGIEKSKKNLKRNLKRAINRVLK
jgi:hypothetical protein